ncbi:MAG: homoserine O-acetyltransferase [Pseudomonadota bacterium]
MGKLWSAGVGAAMILVTTATAWAYEPLVEKQVFEMGPYTTVGGATIPEVRVGWEAYGTLNEARDNVILITHFFSATSHAAGSYVEGGPKGYWDYLIGSGKPLDTDRFYVISSDTLVNLNTGDPNVTTTGPASIDPATGEPYGMDFPVVTIRDFVEVQRALLESLGIERLHAVMGASMGALQALEWASAHPEMVERLIPVIGAGEADAFLIGALDAWAAPIRLDPNWQGGDYYDGEPPLDGLAAALALVTLQAQHWQWADAAFGRAWNDDAVDPAGAVDATYHVQAALAGAGAARAKTSDANHFLYLVKANQLFRTGHGDSLVEGLARIEAPTLMLYSPDDLVFPAAKVQATATLIGADGTPVETYAIAGRRGHLDGVLNLQQVEAVLRAFLE